MNITIVGTGYVGLVSGVCLAHKGHKVTCIDLRTEVVGNLNKGIPHIHEKGLDDLLNSVIKNKNFNASTDLKSALKDSQVVIIAVGTPSENGEIDLAQIKQASESIADFIKSSSNFLSIIIKSTVVPSTTDTFVKNIIESKSGKVIGEFGLGMNPEFLREGEAIEDFLFPDRIVIGYEDEKTRKLLNEIYSPWACDKIEVNTRTAEMIKYTNNTVLACLISLNNELANYATSLGGIDYNDIVKGVASDKRWSPIIENKRVIPSITSYMTPGAGFGGSCFPKDVQAIRTHGMKEGLPMLMTNAILAVNDKQAENALDSLSKTMGDKYNSSRVLHLGLAFKPGTDDIRESSAIKILQNVSKNCTHVYAHDPIAIENTRKLFSESNISFIENWQDYIENIDIIIVGTNWDEYKILPQLETKGILRDKIIFDSKRLFAKNSFKKNKYITIGYR